MKSSRINGRSHGTRTVSQYQLRRAASSVVQTLGAYPPLIVPVSPAVPSLTVAHRFPSIYVTASLYDGDGYLVPPTRITSIKVYDDSGTFKVDIAFNRPFTGTLKLTW